MNQLAQNTALTPPTLDGWDVESEQSTRGYSFLRFDGTAPPEDQWRLTDGNKAPSCDLIATNSEEGIQKWELKRITERFVLQHDKPLPDIDALNSAVDEKLWEKDFNGDSSPPYQAYCAVYLFDPEIGARFVASNSTFGHRIAFDNL